jgi:hypothetical protein
VSKIDPATYLLPQPRAEASGSDPGAVAAAPLGRISSSSLSSDNDFGASLGFSPAKLIVLRR